MLGPDSGFLDFFFQTLANDPTPQEWLLLTWLILADESAGSFKSPNKYTGLLNEAFFQSSKC